MNFQKYCYNCDKDVNINLKEETINMSIKGANFSFIGNLAYCTECGEEVYVAEFDDDNIRKANEIYREKKGIIKVNEIEELLCKYNIGKEPLANLLGWGEKTILRYCNGLTPIKEYNDKLRELNNPIKMKELFEKNKEKLTDIAREKLAKKLQELLEPIGKVSRLFDVAKYFLKNVDIESEEFITPLKLQKLVYYSQAWALAFFKKTLFDEDFQAWVHGPTVPSLYFHYKNYGYNPILRAENFNENIFDSDERLILNFVWRTYGKYGAKFLEQVTHSEEPWKKARGSCKSNEKCNNVISKGDIQKFYSNIEQVRSLNDIEKYVGSFIYY